MEFGPRKRIVQEALSQALRKEGLYSKGTVLGLSGANPIPYINVLMKYNLGDHYELFEKDEKLYSAAKRCLANYIAPPGVTQDRIYRISQEDILTCSEWPDRISGIDLDFCKTLQESDMHGIICGLIGILENNTLKDVWLRITSSFGYNADRQSLLERLDTILERIEKYTKWYRVGYRQKRAYHDTRTMLVWQVKLRRDDMPSSKMGNRSFKDLTSEEKQIVRDLVSLDYSPDTIGKIFRLSKNSLASIKAHKTMGNYHEKV